MLRSLKLWALRLPWFALVAVLGLSLCDAQKPSEAPARPYRERLLERAQKGDAEAQFELGKNYETGRIGLPKDVAQAEFWYKKAAEQGDPYSEASLGILYDFAKGVERNYVQAYMWYERAAAHSKGANRDSIIEMRDSLAQKMTQPQIAEAQRLAKEWKPPAGSSK